MQSADPAGGLGGVTASSTFTSFGRQTAAPVTAEIVDCIRPTN
jgi:hypothetical protein